MLAQHPIHRYAFKSCFSRTSYLMIFATTNGTLEDSVCMHAMFRVEGAR